MNIINCDATAMKEAGQNLAKISDEYLELIQSFSERFRKISSVTGEWTGEGAELFCKSIQNEDIEKLKNFGFRMKQYGNILIQNGLMLEETIMKGKLDE